MSLSLPDNSNQPLNSNSASLAHVGDGSAISWNIETGARGDRYVPSSATSLPKPGEIRALRAEIGERPHAGAGEPQDLSGQWLRALGAAWTDLPIVATRGPAVTTKPAPTPPPAKTLKTCIEGDGPASTGTESRILLATDLWYAQESIKEPQQRREQLSFRTIRTRPEAPMDEPQSSLTG